LKISTSRDNSTPLLDTLPTRDALLPFMVLASYVVKESISLSKLVDKLPQRFTSSDRIQNFPRENSLKLIEKGLANPDTLIKQFDLKDTKVADIDTTDGLRLTFNDNIIIHLRPSGNAPELRCYVEMDSQELSDSLVKQVLGSVSSKSLVVSSKE